MKSSAPDEQQFALGKPIRDVPHEVQPQTQPHNASGTIQVDARGRLSTNIPGNERANAVQPGPWPNYGFITQSLESDETPVALQSDMHIALIVAVARRLQLGDTAFDINEWGPI